MASYSVTDVLQQARDNGCEAEVERFLKLARSQGLAIQPKKKSIMIAPPQDKTFSLFTIWPNVKASEAGPGKKPNLMYVEVTIEVSVSGTRWDKYLGISEKMILAALEPFFMRRAPYTWGEGRTYYTLYAHIDSSNINEGLVRLDSLLGQKSI